MMFVLPTTKKSWHWCVEQLGLKYWGALPPLGYPLPTPSGPPFYCAKKDYNLAAVLLYFQAFGYLVPSTVTSRLLGVVFDSSTFPEQSRKDKVSTRLTVSSLLIYPSCPNLIMSLQR